MVLRRPWLLDAALAGVALVLAALWPMSAYVLGPAAWPLAVGGVAAVVVILQRPHLGVALALALAPVANASIGGTRLLLPVLAGLVVGLLAYSLLTPVQGTGRMPALVAATTAFAISAAASALGGVDPSEAVSELVWILLALALLVTTVRLCHERTQLIAVAAGAVAGLGLAALQGLAQQLSGARQQIAFAVDGESVNRISGSFGHPNQYAALLAMLLPLAASMAFSSSFRPALRLLAASAVCVAIPALVSSYTRGAVVGLAGGTLIWLALLRPRAVIGVAVLMGLAAFFLAPPAFKDRFEDDSGGDVTLRSDIWGSALDLYSQEPVLGVGLNDFESSYAKLSSSPELSSQRRLLHSEELIVPPHAQNQFLNVLAEQGTLGILTFGLLGATALAAAYRGSRIRDPAGRATSLGAGMGLLVLAIHGLLDVPLFGERIEMPLLVVLGVVTVFVRLDAEERATQRPAAALS